MMTQWKNTALIILLSALTTSVYAQVEPQVINVPLSRPGEPVTVNIEILSAHIEVIGEARDDAQFEVSVIEGTRKIITPSGTKNLNVGAYSVEIEERDNRISLDTDWRANSVRVIARVPQRADLELETVNNGTIRVENITGNLSLSNVNGPITAIGISGSVMAESVNDDIEVIFNRVEGEGVMSFFSVNGDITLGLPDGTGAELHIDNAEGEITSDFEVDVVPSQPVVTREDNRGGVEVKVESVIIAKVAGGGTVFKLKTLNGDIRIRKSN
ncbi:MAG TPA: hypothetical protein VJ984_00825 [Xanthomonadales bacterium]|nr:hypothetical protein [Xanthomonadales bacterium]